MYLIRLIVIFEFFKNKRVLTFFYFVNGFLGENQGFLSF